jgi:hypothetical protein
LLGSGLKMYKMKFVRKGRVLCSREEEI